MLTLSNILIHSKLKVIFHDLISFNFLKSIAKGNQNLNPNDISIQLVRLYSYKQIIRKIIKIFLSAAIKVCIGKTL